MTAAPLLELVPTIRRARSASAAVRERAPSAAGRGAGRPRRAPLAVLVAPAGFGKTTLLCEWAARDPRPFAWVTLDARHDDPAALLRAVSRAVDSRLRESRRTAASCWSSTTSTSCAAPRARDTIAAIVDQLPAEISVALASRAEPPVPLARLRAEGLVTELRQRRSGDDARRGRGAAARRRPASSTATRSTRWCAPPRAGRRRCRSPRCRSPTSPSRARRGALRRRRPARRGVPARRGARRPGRRTSGGSSQQTAILDVLTAPLCDAVARALGLGRHARRGCSAPASRSWRSTARASASAIIACSPTCCAPSCAARDRELEARLHRRASAWHASAGDRERGLQHALAADEVERAGDLVWSGVPALGRAGLERHRRALAEPVHRRPGRGAPAAGAGGRRHAARPTGSGDLAEHWLRRGGGVRRRPRRSPAASPRCARRSGATGSSGWSQDAEHASALLAPGESRARRCAGCCAASPSTCAATPRRRARGSRRARGAPPCRRPHVHALCLAQLALIALERGRLGGRRAADHPRPLAGHPLRARALPDERARARRGGARPRPARPRRGGAQPTPPRPRRCSSG